MTKTKTPFFSLGSHGTLANQLTSQKRGAATLLRRRPIPTDPKTDPQLWHRYLYRQACQYWQTLTQTQKQTWETNARPYHMTGFAQFIRTELNRLQSLILCLPLDEASGSTAIDFSGNLNHGTIYGAQWTAGIINSCLTFDGNDDYATFGNNPSLDTAPITIEAWIYKTGWTGSEEQIINKYDADLSLAWQLAQVPDKRVRLYAYLDDGSSVIFSDAALLLSTWYHLVITITSGEQKLYINGLLQADTESQTGAIKASAVNLMLGNTANRSYFFRGLIDEVRLNNRILDITEIQMHHERRASP